MERRIIGWRMLALICAALLAAFAWAFWQNHQDMRATEDRQYALQRTLTRLQNEQLSLTDELAQVGSSSYIESRARTDYAFLKPGELRFEIINPEGLEGYTAEEMQILMEEMVN